MTNEYAPTPHLAAMRPSDQAETATVTALIDALEPRPIPWEGQWVCKVRNQRGLGIGKTPAEAHEDFFNSLAAGTK